MEKIPQLQDDAGGDSKIWFSYDVIQLCEVPKVKAFKNQLIGLYLGKNDWPSKTIKGKIRKTEDLYTLDELLKKHQDRNDGGVREPDRQGLIGLIPFERFLISGMVS